MTLYGIDSVALGIDDIAAGRRFYIDFGLTEKQHQETGADFQTLDGTTIMLRKIRDRSLPAAVCEGPTVREITWSVASVADIESIAADLGRDRAVTQDAEGTLHTMDDDSYGLAFRLERRRHFEPAPNQLNIYGREPNRPINTRVDFRAAIQPASVAHIVILSPDVPRATRFYVDRLGFRVSDRFKNGKGAFLRSSGSTYHHNLFLLHGTPALHHIAFPVTDFNEVVMGGQRLLERGWEARIGPGRHVIGSNFFWYFKSPLGGAMELTADMDRANDDWPAREWDHVPENTTAWSMIFNPPPAR